MDKAPGTKRWGQKPIKRGKKKPPSWTISQPSDQIVDAKSAEHFWEIHAEALKRSGRPSRLSDSNTV